MKLYLPELANLDWSICHLTPGKIYDGELTPVVYDPQTLQPAPPCYIVICDDGKSRKIDSHYFSKLDELREEKINQILDF